MRPLPFGDVLSRDARSNLVASAAMMCSIICPRPNGSSSTWREYGEGLARKTRNIKVMVWKLFRAPLGNVLEKLAGPGVACMTQVDDTATKRINFASLVLAGQAPPAQYMRQCSSDHVQRRCSAGLALEGPAHSSRWAPCGHRLRRGRPGAPHLRRLAVGALAQHCGHPGVR